MSQIFPPVPAAADFDWAQIAAIPVAECGAPLQILPPNPRWRVRPVYFEQDIDGALPQVVLRAPVVERLRAALEYLPPAYGFEILDGWRSLRVQAALRAAFRQQIVARHPEYDEAQIREALDQFVADPQRAQMTPPHLSGGAVDLTLFDIASGAVLEMGTAFDEPSHRSHSSALEQAPPTPAQQHRRMLVHAMTMAGFTNLPTEWWHFDYGNQNWAFFSGQCQARFGAAHWPDSAPAA